MSKKDLKNIILGCIFGITVTSIIGVSALISTGTLSYTPKDSTWNVNTAQGALDSLYDVSLTGKNNIITALNSKGLSLDSHTEYSNIVEGINSLPVGKTESGEWGFVPEGEINAQPYKGAMKRVLLGTVSNNSPSTFNLTSYEGYQNFTNNNFAFGSVSSSVSSSYRIGLSGGGTSEGYTTIGFNPTLSYNSSTGILTIGDTASKSGAQQRLNSSGSCSVTVYLFY